MWRPNTVERALFRWKKWRNSIIKHWAVWKYDKDWLEKVVSQELGELGLPASSLLEIYWISCLTSDYNLDYTTTYARIVTPTGLKKGGFEVNPGIKIYPPQVIREEDVKFESSQYGIPRDALIRLYSYASSDRLLLKSDHELLGVLKDLRGRPGIRGKQGPIPHYHDRLAVQCAALKDRGMSYVEIAKRLGLPVTRRYSSYQSDVVRHLVRRGRKLLRELIK
jgi:hypothetical protein